MKRFPFVFVLVLVLSVQVFHAGRSCAQTATTSQATPLQPFVGKYQFTDNKNVFLQILLQDGHLVLKQLWDKQELPFKQMSALEFYNDDHEFPLKFSKNEKGEITEVLAFDRDVWKRVPDNYTPELAKIIKLSAEQLKAFEGNYQRKDGDGDADDKVIVTAAGDHLVLKRQQNETNLLPVSESDFVNDNQMFSVKFTKAADGTVTQALVNKRDVWLKVK